MTNILSINYTIFTKYEITTRFYVLRPNDLNGRISRKTPSGGLSIDTVPVGLMFYNTNSLVALIPI